MAGPLVPVGGAGSNGPTGPQVPESALLELSSIPTKSRVARLSPVSKTSSRP